MDKEVYKRYRDNHTALNEVTALVERLAENKIKVFSGGDNAPLDKDKYITSWQLGKRFKEMGGSSLGEFDSVISSLYRQVKNWRRDNKPKSQLSFKQTRVQQVGTLRQYHS